MVRFRARSDTRGMRHAALRGPAYGNCAWQAARGMSSLRCAFKKRAAAGALTGDAAECVIGVDAACRRECGGEGLHAAVKRCRTALGEAGCTSIQGRAKKIGKHSKS